MSEHEQAERVWTAMHTLVRDRTMKDAVAAETGMSFSRARALPRLLEGPLTLRELAKSMATDAPYTTLIVDDLENRGWVERRTHPEDRRSKLVVLTDTGREAAERTRRIMSAPPAWLIDLPSEDLAHLDRLFGGVLPHDAG